MKRKMLIFTFTAVLVLGLAGCSNEKKAGESITEEVDGYTDEVEEAMGGQLNAPSEAVTKAVSNNLGCLGQR